MLPGRIVVAMAIATLLTSVAAPSHAQTSATETTPHGPESQSLARLREPDSDDAPLPRIVADAAARAGTALPDGIDADLAGRLQMPTLPLRLTPRIASYLARYRNDRISHRALASWLRRAGRYRVRLEAIVASEGMPTDLVWVAAAESSFDPNDVSWVGAAGMWQLMPDTARSYGLRVDAWIDERRDPERSTRAAMHLLRDLYARFGSWDLALAAYNMGYAALLRAMRKYNTNDFERIASLEAGLPFETTSYVPRILAAAIAARNLEPLGFTDVAPEAPVAWEDVPVMRSIPLDGVARALGTSVDAIRALNPALQGSRTPPGDDAHPFVLHVPLGMRDRTSAWIEQAHLPEVHSYVIRHGETLHEIARRHGLVDGAALVASCGLPASSRLTAGDTVLVPIAQPASSAPPVDPPLVAVDSVSAPPAGRRRVFYHVVQGDTLREIAQALGVTRDELVSWNALDVNARLQGGLWLQAYIASDPTDARVWEERDVTIAQRGTDAFYERIAASSGRVRRRITVSEGDTMHSLAERYGLTVGSLARINHRSRHATLVPGEELVVYAASESNAEDGAPVSELGNSATSCALPARSNGSDSSAAPATEAQPATGDDSSASPAP
jgi:membrane-bound lytic murein transglycosylase D